MKSPEHLISIQLTKMLHNDNQKLNLFGTIDPAYLDEIDLETYRKIVFIPIIPNHASSIWNELSPLIFQISKENFTQVSELLKNIDCVFIHTIERLNKARLYAKRILFIQDESNKEFMFRFFDINVAPYIKIIIQDQFDERFIFHSMNKNDLAITEVKYHEGT